MDRLAHPGLMFPLFMYFLLSLTCSPPVTDSARLLVNLPTLLEGVSEGQHASSAQRICEQQIPALEKRPPKEPYPDQKFFTRLGKHDVRTSERLLFICKVEKRDSFLFKRLNMQNQCLFLPVLFNTWLSG